MLTRLFMWLCRRMTIHAVHYKSGTHVNGYTRDVGPIMADYVHDAWKGEDRGIVCISASSPYDRDSKDHPMRQYIRRIFVWACMIVTKQFGELWSCSDGKNQDYTWRIGKGTSVGWGEYKSMYKKTEFYAEVHTKQYIKIKRKHKVRYIRKPFKGNSAYEFQICGIVLMIYYPHSQLVPDRKRWKVGWFWDCYWTRSFTPSPLTRVVTWLSKNGEHTDFSEDSSVQTWNIGKLAFRTVYDPRLNFYTILWGERTLWGNAD
jgi:hypothetical protein